MFADLHRPGKPLVLPNAWDHASAATLAAAGFAAVGTTSLGVAAGIGVRDGAVVAMTSPGASAAPDGAAAETTSPGASAAPDTTAAETTSPGASAAPDSTAAETTSPGAAAARGVLETAEATVALARRLAHLPVYVTVDIENGFSTDPVAVAAYVARLPAAGINLEDQLAPPAAHAAVLRAVTGGELFVNARIDTYWLGAPSLAETLRRAEVYVDAGADGIFVPGVADERVIATLAERIPVPLNVLAGPIPVPRLAELGVARVSTGSFLYRAALGAATAAAAAVRDGAALPDAPTYRAINSLAG